MYKQICSYICVYIYIHIYIFVCVHVYMKPPVHVFIAFLPPIVFLEGFLKLPEGSRKVSWKHLPEAPGRYPEGSVKRDVAEVSWKQW